MNKQELRDALTKIHAELEHAPELDAQAQQLLREIMADVERITTAPPADETPESAIDNQSRIEALAVGFEADHPVLAGELRQIVNLLSSVGL
jgi:Domain of unknown function (DUF4404)